MPRPRVTPWQEGEPVPPALLEAIRARREDGALLPLDTVLLRSLPLAEGWNALLGRVRGAFALPLIYREMMICRVAILNGAAFEWETHEPVYRAAGGSAAQCAALRGETFAAAAFDETEQLLLTMTDQSTRSVAVDEAVIAALVAGLGETQTVEAVATVAAYNMVSRFLVALGI